MTAKLKVKKISKKYGSKLVLKDISLEVNKGEIIALLGPNGAGKTTCFYAIAGLISQDGGQVILGEQDISNLPIYKRAQLGVGYLPQENSIFRGLTVEQNILSVIELKYKKKKDRLNKLEKLLNEFKISHIKESSALSLSGGERRRVEIARCLASEPKFVLLDEPFAGVDPIAVGDIRELVSHLKDQGIGVVITDHNVRETLEIVDRAYIIFDGRVLMSGTPDEIVSNENVRELYLGSNFRM